MYMLNQVTIFLMKTTVYKKNWWRHYEVTHWFVDCLGCRSLGPLKLHNKFREELTKNLKSLQYACHVLKHGITIYCTQGRTENQFKLATWAMPTKFMEEVNCFLRLPSSQTV